MSMRLVIFSIVVWHGRMSLCQRYAERNPLPMDTQPYQDDYDEYETESFNFEDYLHIHRWNVEDFPHPQKDFRQCNRMKASFICDPDNILVKEQMDKLESSIEELYKKTPCICDQCNEEDGGIVIGIAILKNVFQPYNEHYIQTIRNFAEKLRGRWQLGKCDNDILIVVATTDRLSYTDVGKATTAYVTLKEAYRIFQENKAHFSAGRFYEGLNDMISDYYEKTKDMKRPVADKLNVALISGSIFGSVVLLAIILLILVICYKKMKQKVKRRDEENRKTFFSEVNKTLAEAQYQPCSTEETGAPLSSFKIDEEEIIDTTLATPRQTKQDHESGRKPEGVASSWTKKDIKVIFGSLKVNETPAQAQYQPCSTEETDAPFSSFRIDEEEVIDTTLATSGQVTSDESDNLDKDLTTAVEGLTQSFKPTTFRRNETNL